MRNLILVIDYLIKEYGDCNDINDILEAIIKDLKEDRRKSHSSSYYSCLNYYITELRGILNKYNKNITKKEKKK